MNRFQAYLHRSGKPALNAVYRRKRGSILTSLGVAMGIFSLVAMLALSTTVQAQVASRFTELMATKITVSGIPDAHAAQVQAAGTSPTPGGNQQQPSSRATPTATQRYLHAGIERVRGLNGVQSAGFHLQSAEPVPIRQAHGLPEVTQTAVIVADTQSLAAHKLQPLWGEAFDSGHVARGARVAYLGTTAARELGISNHDAPAQIIVGNAAYALAGVFSSPDPSDGFDEAIVLPLSSGHDTGAVFNAPTITISTQAGYARQAAVEAPLAFDPQGRFGLFAEVPPDPQSLREQVSGDTQVMVYAFGIVALIIGALSISNTMLVSVLQRRHEIGVRSALGATSRDIVAQVVSEGMAIGAVGGLLGAIAGIDTILIFALIQNWSAVIPLWLIPAGLVLGVAVGGLASIYPAVKAARVDPVEALMG